MEKTAFISEQIGENSEFVIVKLNRNVLGGDEALELTNLVNEQISQNVKYVIIDVNDVEFMNSTGLGMLANAHTILSKNGSNLFLISVPEKITKLLKMTHLDRVFQIFNSIDDILVKYKLKI